MTQRTPPANEETRYLKGREIAQYLSIIEDVEKRQSVLEEKMTELEQLVKQFIEERKSQRKQILNDLEVE